MMIRLVEWGLASSISLSEDILNALVSRRLKIAAVAILVWFSNFQSNKLIQTSKQGETNCILTIAPSVK